MKTKTLLASLLSLILSLPIASQPIAPGSLTNTVSQHMEFSSGVRDYFGTEIEHPSDVKNPLSVQHKEYKAKIRIATSPLECGGWRLTFEFPKPVTFKQEIDERGLYLVFNQPIDSPDLLPAQEKLSYLIKRFSSGLNSLLLTPKKPVFYKTDASETTFILEITPDIEAPIELTKSLKIAAARLLIEERAFMSAVNALSQLNDEYPNDKDILLLYANLYSLFPLWQDQVELLNTLATEYPRDEDILQLFWDAYSPHTPYLQLERQVQRTIGLAAVQLYGIRTEDIILTSPDSILYMGAQDQVWSGHIGAIVNNLGETVSFKGARLQGQIWQRKEWDDGSRLGGTLYAQSRVMGFSLEGGRLLPSIQGACGFIAAWHRPYWAIFETLAYRGREDLIKFDVSSIYNRRINWSLEAGAHRVGITGTPNGLSSFLLSGEFFYNILVANPVIALNYGLDAEYIIHQKVKVGINGNLYNPVPYTTFENHSLRAYFIYQWRERWTLTLFGGETFNRLGTHDYTLGANIKYVKSTPCAWEFELSAYRFPSTIIQGATAEYFTATLTTRF